MIINIYKGKSMVTKEYIYGQMYYDLEYDSYHIRHNRRSFSTSGWFKSCFDMVYKETVELVETIHTKQEISQ